ncbi:MULTISPECIES: hypothetical protein [Streptomyces]
MTPHKTPVRTPTPAPTQVPAPAIRSAPKPPAPALGRRIPDADGAQRAA